MKVVAALAIMKNGKILMGKRKDNGKWTNPGGHVEEGESPIDGAMREAKEEAGLELTHDRLYHLDTRIVETPGGKIRVHGYKVNLDEGTTTIKNDPDDEVHRWHWVSLKPPLNKDIFDNLHVPLEDNVLLGAMEIKLEKNAFFVGFEKRASSWDVADDFATDMRSKKSPLAELATNFAANGSVPENSSDRKNLKREYIKYHKAYINDTVSSRKADWKKMKDKPKDTVSSGLKGSAIMSLLGMGLGGMGGAALGAPLKLLAKTRGIGKAMAPIGAAAGGLAGGVAGYKAGRSNPYYNMSEKGLKSSVDKEYDAPLHYINHQPFKKKVRE